MSRQKPPRQWSPRRNPAPKVLGITLTGPYSEAFLHEDPEDGGPGHWKDIENRKPGFPMVPAGTLLALHNSASWDEEYAKSIQEKLPRCTALTKEAYRPGLIVGVVTVQETMRGELFLPRKSRWYLGWGVSMWLTDERWRLPEPIPFEQGWFGAWELPSDVERRVLEAVSRHPPLRR